MAKIMVAAVQLTITRDPVRNLRAMLDRLDEAAGLGARLILFPSGCNRTANYRSQDECWQTAIETDSPFMAALQDRASRRGCYIAFGATVRGEYPVVYEQAHILSPQGTLVGTAQRQLLTDRERGYITAGDHPLTVFDTELGRIGLCPGLDAVLPEPSRALALQGAQILLVCHTSSAQPTRASAIAVRAAENKVWVLAAGHTQPPVNTSMPAVPNGALGQPRAAEAGGASLVVAPDGAILVQAPAAQDGIALAEIEPALADDKSMVPSGDLVADRRPASYALLTCPNHETPLARRGQDRPAPAASVRAAAIQVASTGLAADVIERAARLCEQASDDGAQLLVLPETFIFGPGTLSGTSNEVRLSQLALERLREVAHTRKSFIVVSLVETEGKRYYHTIYAVDERGEIAAAYRQVHLRPTHRAWAKPGDSFVTVDTAFGVLGLMAGYDGLFVESTRILARMGADIIACPTSWTEPWEPRLAIHERAAENRVQIVACNRPDSYAPHGSVIVRLDAAPTGQGVAAPFRDEARWGKEMVLHSTISVPLSRDKRVLGADVVLGARPEHYSQLAMATESIRP